MAAQASPGGGANQNTFSRADINGAYAYRFSGYNMQSNVCYRLLGLGQFQISDAGLTGSHRASITAMSGGDAKLITATYGLSGSITLNGDGSGDATITFTRTTGDGTDVMVGQFYVQVAGTADRLWLVSSGATVPGRDNAAADEIVEVEAVRLGQSPH